jgi:hypothetical protein
MIQINPESTMPNDRFVAVGLLTRRDLDVLGSGFCRAFPLQDTTDFTSLLIKIDRAEETLGWRASRRLDAVSSPSGAPWKPVHH